MHRGALLPPEKSPFTYLHESGQDDTMIATTGFNYASFHSLHLLFKPYFDDFTPYTGDGRIRRLNPATKGKGKQRSVTSITCLGLVLTWTRTRGSLRVLQLVFIQSHTFPT